jgi:hypothetical protein
MLEVGLKPVISEPGIPIRHRDADRLQSVPTDVGRSGVGAREVGIHSAMAGQISGSA